MKKQRAKSFKRKIVEIECKIIQNKNRRKGEKFQKKKSWENGKKIQKNRS